MRVALLSESWSSRPDEGMLRFLDRLARVLDRQHEVRIYHERGDVPPGLSSRRLPLGKGLVTPALKEAWKASPPDLVIYCPTACATLGALLRHRRLERAFPSARCALLSLQRRRYGRLGSTLLRWLRPWRMVVLSESDARWYRDRGFEALAVPAGVDLERFRPADADARRRARERWGLDPERPVALHVGHLAAFRGLEALADLARAGRVQVLVIASTANPADLDLKRRLEAAGVRVHHGYVESIEEAYQAADVYLFPVVHGSGSIEFPLSVLEAMSCDLPVLSTPFGALPESFPAGGGLHYLAEGEDLDAAVRRALDGDRATRSRVARRDWAEVLGGLPARLMEQR